MIKVFRILKAIKKFNVGYLMAKIKKHTISQIEKEIERNPTIGEDTVTDHNNIEYLLKIGYALKIFKLVLVILNTSYFVGIIFLIIADVSITLAYHLGDTDQEFFITYNEINSNTETYNTLLVVYFAFTSLSTVGFGDLNPRSDFERIFVAFMLLFGVAIFSYIMGVFIEIL